jgi:hypothetical protein
MRIKKSAACIVIALVCLIAASVIPVSRAAVFHESAGVFPSPGRQNQSTNYDIGGGISLDRYACAEETDEALWVSLVNPSDVDRRMHKEAAVARRLEQRSILKAYAAEHRRSVTEGGKNSIISSADLFKTWRDALRPLCFA